MSLKYYYFTTDNDWDFPVLTDKCLNKKLIVEKIETAKSLILGFAHKDGKVVDNQIMILKLKYGDRMFPLNQICPDRTPVIFKDYIPRNFPDNFDEMKRLENENN